MSTLLHLEHCKVLAFGETFQRLPHSRQTTDTRGFVRA